MLERLRNQLIVSCQPVSRGPMDQPEIVAAMAQAAVLGGAAGLRIEGIQNVCAVRRVCRAPIIGIVKRDIEGSDVRITPLVEDVGDLISAGAEIVAFDATARARPASVLELVAEVRSRGALAMADCASWADAAAAAAMGAEILGTTLSGYTSAVTPEEPDIELVSTVKRLGRFTIAEGRFNTAELAGAAVRAGADAVVVGSAITRLEWVTTRFCTAIRSAGQEAA